MASDRLDSSAHCATVAETGGLGEDFVLVLQHCRAQSFKATVLEVFRRIAPFIDLQSMRTCLAGIPIVCV